MPCFQFSVKSSKFSHCLNFFRWDFYSVQSKIFYIRTSQYIQSRLEGSLGEASVLTHPHTEFLIEQFEQLFGATKNVGSF